MGSEVAVYKGFDDFADELRQMDGEWCISHVTLARIMRMSHPKDLADRIERHEVWLNRISRLRTVRNRPDGGGREWNEYFLGKDHCVYLIAKSDMPEGNDLCVFVVQVFSKALRGADVREALIRVFTKAARGDHRAWRSARRWRPNWATGRDKGRIGNLRTIVLKFRRGGRARSRQKRRIPTPQANAGIFSGITAVPLAVPRSSKMKCGRCSRDEQANAIKIFIARQSATPAG